MTFEANQIFTNTSIYMWENHLSHFFYPIHVTLLPNFLVHVKVFYNSTWSSFNETSFIPW